MPLTISRRQGESFWISDNIKVTITDSIGKVRVTIDAPKEVAVTREELFPEGETPPATREEYYERRRS